MVPIESVEYNGVDDHGWKEVVSRKKRHRKQKPADKSNVADRNGNLKAEETEKRPDWELSLAKAAAKFRPSDLSDHFNKVPASQGSLPAGLYSWVHSLFPLFPENPLSRDPILKLVEKILAKPDAQTILVNAPVWDGRRLIPPQRFKIFMRVSFPVTSARDEFTTRFVDIYPLLKKVALARTSRTEAIKEIFTLSLELAGVEGNPVLAEEATAIAILSLTEMADCWKYWESIYKEDLKGSIALLKEIVRQYKDSTLGSKAMIKQRQIFTFALKLTGEVTRNRVLAKEATSIAIWSLKENFNCWKHWDNLYKENLEVSVILLKKLVDEWKVHSLKLSSSPSDTLTLSQTMKSFMLKNKKAITEREANASLYKEADKSCKVISRRLTRGSSCLKCTTITAVVLVASVVLAAGTHVLSSNP